MAHPRGESGLDCRRIRNRRSLLFATTKKLHCDSIWQSSLARLANYLCCLDFRTPLGSANDFSELSQHRLCPFAGSPTFLQWTALHTVPITSTRETHKTLK